MGLTLTHPTQMFAFARQMLLALEVLHKNNVVHLDIKPANIFIKVKQHNRTRAIGQFCCGTFEPRLDLPSTSSSQPHTIPHAITTFEMAGWDV